MTLETEDCLNGKNAKIRWRLFQRHVAHAVWCAAVAPEFFFYENRSSSSATTACST